jgi:hypothetical protein
LFPIGRISLVFLPGRPVGLPIAREISEVSPEPIPWSLPLVTSHISLCTKSPAFLSFTANVCREGLAT